MSQLKTMSDGLVADATQGTRSRSSPSGKRGQEPRARLEHHGRNGAENVVEASATNCPCPL